MVPGVSGAESRQGVWRVFGGVSDPLGASAGPWKGVHGVFGGCCGGLVRSAVVAMRVALRGRAVGN